MKPVYQEITELGKGDCFRCCLASLLETEREAVPNFRALETDTGVCMMDAARDWLRERHKLSIVTVYVGGDDLALADASSGTPCIATVESPNRKGGQHAVVGEIDDSGMNFVITHDPNANGKKVSTRPIYLQFLVPLNYK